MGNAEEDLAENRRGGEKEGDEGEGVYKYMLDAAALYHPRENAISHDILPR